MILVVPGGDAHTYPISHGTENFEPYRADKSDPNSLWLVDVPAEFAVHLLHNAGFSMYHDQTGNSHPGEAPKVRLKHPAGRGCGWGSTSYEPDADGVVEVPAAAVADLKWHGFEPAPVIDQKQEPLVPAPMEHIEAEREAAEGEEQYRTRRGRRG